MLLLTNQKNKGQSLIEFVIAIGVLVIITASGTTALLSSLSINRFAKEGTQASGYAQEGLEAAKSIRNQDWDNLENGPHGADDSSGSWKFMGSSNIFLGKFTRVIVVEDAELEGEALSETKKITSTVSWNHIPSKTSRVKYITYLTDWQTTKAYVPGGIEQGTCNNYCLSVGYSSGSCKSVPSKCQYNMPYANQFCLGGPSEDNCCCTE